MTVSRILKCRFLIFVFRSDSGNAMPGWISPSTSSSLIDATSSGWEATLVPNFSIIPHSGHIGNDQTEMYKFKVRNKPKDNTFTVLLFERDPPLHSFTNIHTYQDSMNLTNGNFPTNNFLEIFQNFRGY